MQANAESVQGQVTMRGLIDRYTEEVLRLPLSVPVGGTTPEGARIEFRTADGYKGSLRNYILPRWQNYALRDFEKPAIQASAEEWFRSLCRSADNPDGLAPKSVRQVYAAMSQVFKFGVKWGYLNFNPLAGPAKRIELPRGSTKRLKIPTQISPSQFLLLMSNLFHPQARLAVGLAGWLGLRVSEVFGLQWQDLDLEAGIVSFKRGYTNGRISRLKTEASRTDFSIPEELVELLGKWYSLTTYTRPTDWVFASPCTRGERPFCPQAMMLVHIQPLARDLGLPHIGWHTFRHSLSAWAKEMGLTADDRKTLLRHQSLQMGDVYGTADLERKKQLQNTITAHVKKQVGQEGRTKCLGAGSVGKTA